LLPKLDFARRSIEKQWIVRFWPDNFYEEWRERGVATELLHDVEPIPPERLLQQIWLHQRLRREGLVTTDGRPVRILHPGFWNHESGPDFQKAIIQFGTDTPQVGAVEIDLSSSLWKGHGHEGNPRYGEVVLHVIWEGASKPTGRPTLIMKPALDAPLGELALWFAAEGLPKPHAIIGQCSAPLQNLGVAALNELLRQAAQVRLHRKATQLQARARDAGWEQTLWEFTLAALGYKHNHWPMRRLGELTPWALAGSADSVILEARLLGLGNLLPRETKAGSDSLHLRRLWDAWWREADAASPLVLPRASWCMAGIRPANQPARRLALGAGWLADGQLMARLEDWLLRSVPVSALAESLEEVLAISAHEFWEFHWTLRSPRFATPQPLLGSARATDLAVNVFLPWLWMRAVTGQNASMRRVAEERYFAWPSGQDNSTLKLGRQRLMGHTSSKIFHTAAAQQGLLQITRDFCDHSNALCQNCHFPELVKVWQVRMSH